MTDYQKLLDGAATDLDAGLAFVSMLWSTLRKLQTELPAEKKSRFGWRVDMCARKADRLFSTLDELVDIVDAELKAVTDEQA